MQGSGGGDITSSGVRHTNSWKMGKRRNTAKTGDKALYKSRPNVSGGGAANIDDDGMYNAVDRFHNRREQQEFVKLDAGGADIEEDYDDGISGREGVLDLGGGESSSDEEEDDDNDDDSIDEPVDKKQRRHEESSEEEPSSGSDDEDALLETEDSDVRDWGRNISSYYYGDTADLEIGQDEDDAFLEEEAAKEVQAARYEQMDEDDFVMSDDEEDKELGKEKATKTITDIRSTKHLSKLSRSDRRRLLQSHHPELTPLVSHFKHVVEEWDSRTSVVTNAVFDGDEGTMEAIGATAVGIQYLVTKALLQSSTALNVAMYILLKSEQATAEEAIVADRWDVGGDGTSAIQSHPVVVRLHRLNKLGHRLEDQVESKVETLSKELDNLVKASDMMNGDEDDKSSQARAEESDEEASLEGTPIAEIPDAPAATVSTTSEEAESEDDIATEVMNEARFGLRPQELVKQEDKEERQPRRAVPLDFGDEEDEGLTKKAALSLATTVNTIEQRSATRSRKKRAAHTTEDLDEPDDDNEALRQGLEMMEEELGRESDHEVEKNTELDEELDDDVDENNFYKSVKRSSEAKKQQKAAQYAVAPKYPGIEQEIHGERAISKSIMKNRGLVAHKSKLNRNPRVKKREQYRKALVRRKGHVREVRTEEGHKYGGEETGIKSGLSRSRKLGK